MAFVIFYHKHFYCISVKYNVCMHVSVFVLMLLFPWQRQKKQKQKNWKKNWAHSSCCVEIPPTSNLLNEEKNLLFVIFSETFALVWCI